MCIEILLLIWEKEYKGHFFGSWMFMTISDFYNMTFKMQTAIDFKTANQHFTIMIILLWTDSYFTFR